MKRTAEIEQRGGVHWSFSKRFFIAVNRFRDPLGLELNQAEVEHRLDGGGVQRAGPFKVLPRQTEFSAVQRKKPHVVVRLGQGGVGRQSLLVVVAGSLGVPD